MKKKIKYLFLIWLLLIALPISAYFIRENTEVKPGIKNIDDNFTIENYDITLNVNNDNTISVREEITIDVEKPTEGLYKIIPKWEKINNQNRKVSVSEVHVNGENFDFNEDIKSYQIRIGSNKNKISTGLHTFMIRYDLNLGTDPNNEYDELVYEAFAQYKNNKIKNSSITINMPKAFKEKNVSFTSNNKKTTDVDYEINNNTIEAKIKNNNKNSITLNIKLDDNYFKNTSNNYGYTSLIIIFIMILLSIIIIYKWIINRLTKLSGIEKLEHYPPKEYDVAELGYLQGETDVEKLASLLIISLASKGYLAVEGKKIINLTKTVNAKQSRVIEITKLKNSNIENTQTERRFLDRLFFNGVAYFTRDFDKLYKIITPLEEKGYITISDTVKEITPEIKEKIVATSLNYDNLTYLEAELHKYLFMETDVVELNEETLDNIVPVITEPLNKNVHKKVHSEKTTKLVRATIYSSLIMMALWMITYLIVFDLNPKLYFMYFVAFALLFIASFVGIIIERFAPYGEKTLAKANNFKEYISSAKEGSLDQLVNENRNYFYEILPYAYALGIKDKWFEAVTNSTIVDENNYKMFNDMEV